MRARNAWIIAAVLRDMKCKDMQPWPTLKATSLRGAFARSPWKRPRCGQPHPLDRGEPVTRVVMTPSPVFRPRSTSTTAKNDNLQALHKLSQRSQKHPQISYSHFQNSDKHARVLRIPPLSNSGSRTHNHGHSRSLTTTQTPSTSTVALVVPGYAQVRFTFAK